MVTSSGLSMEQKSPIVALIKTNNSVVNNDKLQSAGSSVLMTFPCCELLTLENASKNDFKKCEAFVVHVPT